MLQTVFLALGANLGDRLAALRGARESLRGAPGVQVVASSALYETDPAGGPEGQGSYLNAVLEARTDLSPRDLLHLCLTVEGSFGRQRLEHWGPRSLDIDILMYGEEIRRSPDLILPHPRMHQRSFVLQPLRDLAPELIHPVLRLSVGELADFEGAAGVRLLARSW